MPDMVKVRTALFSVSDRSGLSELAGVVRSFGADLLASGGTFSALREAGVEAKSIQDELKLPTSLDGRVKTLHAPLHAAILAKATDSHMAELRAMGVRPLDMVVCNFYPFREAAKDPSATEEDLVEKIDIGGPTMVRGASKNFDRVLVVPSPGLYAEVIAELRRHEGATTREFRRAMAAEAFSITASYDSLVSERLRPTRSELPARLTVSASKYKDAKYGENPGQKAVIYSIDGWKTMADWRQLAGDTLSFNNLLDIGGAYEMVEGYDEWPAVATVKHGQISGFALGPTVAEAYRLAHSCDPEADFGGTVVSNRGVDAQAAKLIGRNEGIDDSSVYTEIVIAPAFSDEAVSILESKQKKKIRVIQADSRPDYPYDIKVIEGAVLVQDAANYRRKLDATLLTFPTKAKPDRDALTKLLAAWEVVRRVQSNGIVIADGSVEGGRLVAFWTLGVGSFRKRNGAVKIALDNAGERARGAVCASDGFFPFRDSVDLLAAAGVSSVIQPGGSANDSASIHACDEHGMAMVFTQTRAFKH